jgi:hypothetical protein
MRRSAPTALEYGTKRNALLPIGSIRLLGIPLSRIPILGVIVLRAYTCGTDIGFEWLALIIIVEWGAISSAIRKQFQFVLHIVGLPINHLVARIHHLGLHFHIVHFANSRSRTAILHSGARAQNQSQSPKGNPEQPYSEWFGGQAHRFARCWLSIAHAQQCSSLAADQ